MAALTAAGFRLGGKSRSSNSGEPDIAAGGVGDSTSAALALFKVDRFISVSYNLFIKKDPYPTHRNYMDPDPFFEQEANPELTHEINAVLDSVKYSIYFLKYID